MSQDRAEHVIINGQPKITQVWIPKNNILLVEYEPARNMTH